MAKTRRASKRGRVAEAAASYGASHRLLLDTQAWLWWQSDDRRLGRRARAAVAAATEVHFSAASAWEIAIKAALGKLELPDDFAIVAELERDGFVALPISIDHAVAAGMLPTLHRDPFDRMLVAQARHEGLTLLTGDRQLGPYGVPVISAID